MSAITGGRSAPANPFEHRYDEIRRRRAPTGVTCPHCLGASEIYFSSAQLRRPVHKRFVFVWLRCHSCTHRFRYRRLAPLVFWTIAAIACMFVSLAT